MSQKINNMKRLKLTLLICLLFASPNLTHAIEPLTQAKLFLSEANYTEALHLLNTINSTTENVSQIYYLKGKAENGLYKTLKAISSFQKSYELDSSKIENLSEIAECYRLIGNYQKASDLYKLRLMKNNNDIQLQLDAASLFLSTEEYSTAKTIYEKLYKEDSSNVYVIRCLAKCYDNLNNIDKASEFFRKTIRMNSSDMQSANRLCNIYIGQRKYEEALIVSENYKINNAKNQRISSTNAYIYYLKKNYPEAINRFEKWYKNNDSTLFTLKYLGISCYSNKAYEKAKNYLEKAFQLDSTDVQTCNYLGLACYYSFYKKQAISYMKKAVSIVSPDSSYLSSFYFNLGQAYDAYDKSDCKDAYVAYQKAYQLNPKDGNTLLFLAIRCDRCMNDRQAALEYYKEFLKSARNQKRKPEKKTLLS